jgi:hypothetical protein
MSPKQAPAARQHEDESGRAEWLVAPALGATCDQTVLNDALDAVLLDFKAANAGEIDWLVIGVGARAERVEVLGFRPPLEDIDPGGIHRIGRDGEVETPGCLAGEAHSTGTRNDMGVSVRWVEDEVTGDDEHLPIVPTGRDPVLIKQGRATAMAARTLGLGGE